MFKRIRLFLDEVRINRILSSATSSRLARRLAKSLIISNAQYSFILSGERPPHKPNSFLNEKETTLLAHNWCCLAETYYFAFIMFMCLLSMQPGLSHQFRVDSANAFSSCIRFLLIRYHRIAVFSVDLFFLDRYSYYEPIVNAFNSVEDFFSNAYCYFYRALKAEFYDSKFRNFDEICASCPNVDDLFPPGADPTPLALEAADYQEYVTDRFMEIRHLLS